MLSLSNSVDIVSQFPYKLKWTTCKNNSAARMVNTLIKVYILDSSMALYGTMHLENSLFVVCCAFRRMVIGVSIILGRWSYETRAAVVLQTTNLL